MNDFYDWLDEFERELQPQYIINNNGKSMRKYEYCKEFDEWTEWMLSQLIDENKKPRDLGSSFFQFYEKLDREKKELIHFYWFLAEKQRDFMIALNANKGDPVKRKILEMMMTAWIFRANFNL